MIDCLKMYAGDYIVFASAAFPEFAALSLDEKVRKKNEMGKINVAFFQRAMLKNFAARLYAVESQFGTFRKFGSHEGP